MPLLQSQTGPTEVKTKIKTSFPARKTRLDWLAIVVCAISLLWVFGIGVSRALYPYDVGHLEGGVWAPSQLIVQGQNPYSPVVAENPPYVMAPYGPLYYVLIGVGLELFGAQFWFGRALSMAALAICLWCLARLITRLSGEAHLVAPGLAFFLTQLPVAYWIGMQRPDFVALAFSVSAVTLALSQNHDATQKHFASRPLLIAVLAVAAIFCRQTAVLPLILIAAWYCARREWRTLVVFTATATALLLGFGWLLNTSSNGGYVWQQFLLSASVSKSAQLMAAHFAILFVAPSAILGAVLMIVNLKPPLPSITPSKYFDGVMDSAKDDGAGLRGFLLVYFVLACALALVTSTREGSNINYWLEACALSAVVVSLAWQRWRDIQSRSASSFKAPLNLCLGLIVMAASSCLTGAILAREEVERWNSLRYWNGIVQVIRERVPPGVSCYSLFPELVVAAERPYYFNDFMQYDGRSPRHRRLLEQALRSQTLGALIWNAAKPLPGYIRIPVAGGRAGKTISVDVLQRQTPPSAKPQPVKALTPKRNE